MADPPARQEAAGASSACFAARLRCDFPRISESCERLPPHGLFVLPYCEILLLGEASESPRAWPQTLVSLFAMRRPSCQIVRPRFGSLPAPIFPRSYEGPISSPCVILKGVLMAERMMRCIALQQGLTETTAVHYRLHMH